MMIINPSSIKKGFSNLLLKTMKEDGLKIDELHRQEMDTAYLLNARVQFRIFKIKPRAPNVSCSCQYLKTITVDEAFSSNSLVCYSVICPLPVNRGEYFEKLPSL